MQFSLLTLLAVPLLAFGSAIPNDDYYYYKDGKMYCKQFYCQSTTTNLLCCSNGINNGDIKNSLRIMCAPLL